MIRRGFLGGMIAMTIPGMGGQQPPSQGAAPSGPVALGVQPGVSNITFARLVIVSGPSGAVNGIFIYAAGTNPAAGNGPVLSGTVSSTDPFTNAVQQGWVAYSAPGSASWAALLSAALQLNTTGSVTPGRVLANNSGSVQVQSGTTGAADNTAAVAVQSKNASGVGGRLVSLVSDQTQLTATASANLPLAHLANFPISGAATLAQTIAAVNALYAALVTAQVFAS